MCTKAKLLEIEYTNFIVKDQSQMHFTTLIYYESNNKLKYKNPHSPFSS